MSPPGESLTQLILTENEASRVKWVSALQELHKILKSNQKTSKTVSIWNMDRLFYRDNWTTL